MWYSSDEFFQVFDDIASGFAKRGLEVGDEALSATAARLMLAWQLQGIQAVLKDFDHQICMGIAMAEKNYGAMSAGGDAIASAVATLATEQ